MNSRLKVTDGDFILIFTPLGLSDKTLDSMGEEIKKWLKRRGLHNTEGQIVQTSGTTTTVTVLSVNDVFDDLVLKDGK